MGTLAGSVVSRSRAFLPTILGKGPRDLRVKGFRSRSGWEGYQLLQERRWWGWHTIEREEIPGHVIVSLGCYGDTGGWTSRFARLGRFGEGGRIIPASAAG